MQYKCSSWTKFSPTQPARLAKVCLNRYRGARQRELNHYGSANQGREDNSYYVERREKSALVNRNLFSNEWHSVMHSLQCLWQLLLMNSSKPEISLQTLSIFKLKDLPLIPSPANRLTKIIHEVFSLHMQFIKPGKSQLIFCSFQALYLSMPLQK